jgi:hypothetical protein
MYMGAANTKPPVDLFPILRLVPERFAKWKRDAKALRELALDVSGRLLGPVRERLAKGYGNNCFMETVYQRAEEWGLDDDAIM